MQIMRQKIRVNGIVQGVGFRPFVYRLARECRLNGFVNNNSEGVVIEVEGQADALERFRARLQNEAPPLARIAHLDTGSIEAKRDIGFTIKQSDHETRSATFIAPDVSICSDCLKELFDPGDRRYLYPFINCTNCGPRYTIVSKIPYDRPNTSMRVFELCPECAREYHDPADRRFHAQPNACPVCGPQLSLFDNTGNLILTDHPIGKVVKYLRRGNIVAIRGLGGFHLAVDAFNDEAVKELRRRKGRAEKPFALMAPDLTTISKFCEISPEEAKALQQQTRPIVLLRAKSDCKLAPSVAPANKYLGFMLPCTPLHYVLLRGNFDALVMTSGNYSEEPIAIANAEALERLVPLADCFLLHNREILQRCDDSIVRVAAGTERMLRRARGYVPAPIFLHRPTQKRILACGGELKNTIAISRENEVFLSQHIGNLDNPAAFDFFEDSIEHLQNILEIEPEIIVYDLHPEYLSTKWALRQTDIPNIGVQHHHAHLLSVMAENSVEERTIGIILDGTGYGMDGTIWGGEVLTGDAREFERFAYLQPVVLPGGEAAVRQPWRMALSYLHSTFGEKIVELDLPFLEKLRPQQIGIVLQMIEKRINAPLTSGCGRLFDAVSALLNICQATGYEAQAAMELEMIADTSIEAFYPEAIPGAGAKGELRTELLIRHIVDDIRNHLAKPSIAAKFHRTVAEIFINAACAARQESGINRVALSGGVFQNIYLFTYMIDRLQEEGFAVLTHRQVPANDGGLALGQVVIANAQLEKARTRYA
jgi:hydrogenase maturation protein HypF